MYLKYVHYKPKKVIAFVYGTNTPLAKRFYHSYGIAVIKHILQVLRKRGNVCVVGGECVEKIFLKETWYH